MFLNSVTNGPDPLIGDNNVVEPAVTTACVVENERPATTEDEGEEEETQEASAPVPFSAANPTVEGAGFVVFCALFDEGSSLGEGNS